MPLKYLSLVRKEMFMYKFTRLLCLPFLVVIALLLSTTNAFAALVRCRTDPIFTLSNGVVVSVTPDIGTAPANVRNISYVLHVPAGVTVKNVAYTAVSLRIPEHYQVRQDSAAKTYKVDTVVTTQNTGRVDVIVYARINAGIRKSISGFNSQLLSLTLYGP
jgi:hypothetical protein